MQTYIVTFQVIRGYTATVTAANEDAAKAEALTAYDEDELGAR